MKVIICGAGQVGANIAAYLSREDNDVIVIDPSQSRIETINDTLDVKGIASTAPYPSVLKQAGIENADMIIAVTESDEKNMIACQVAHSLFNVPKKIARVRASQYLDPAWANLFSRQHMPIDVIISPEEEVAESIFRRLNVIGAIEIIPLAGSSVFMVGVHCNDQCPLINTSLRQIRTLFPDINGKIFAIIRGEERIIPSKDEQILAGDEVYYLTQADQLKRTLSAFGYEEKAARKIVVLGGGNVGSALARKIERSSTNINLKIVERNYDTCLELSKSLEDGIVLNGDILDKSIIKEAGISESEAVIAVTNDDETNILASLMAKHNGAKRVMTLINNTIYTDLVSDLDVDVVINPKSITVSKILQHVRRGRIKGVHNIYDGFAEIIEAEASSSSSIINTPIKDLRLPKGVIIGAIVRNGKVIMPSGSDQVQEKDIVIVATLQAHAHTIEKLFSVNIDFFEHL